MEQDIYAKALERALYNWYFCGENAAPQPVFNAIHAGLNNDMQMRIPIELPEDMIQSWGDLSKVKPGDTFTNSEAIQIRFRHLIIDEEGYYFIPIFTSSEELSKGESSSSINQSLAALLDGRHRWHECVGFVVNPWDKKLVLEEKLLQMMLDYKPKSHISFAKCSVIDMHVDAIVNAANETLLGGGGVDGAIHSAAGPELLKECRALHGCKTGGAKITRAYNIYHADYIIHTVGPVYSGSANDAAMLTRCYMNSLDLALKHGCTSIAFPGTSTGVYGYPQNEAAKVSLLAIVHWLDAHPDTVMNIYLCCFKDAEFEAYESIIKR